MLLVPSEHQYETTWHHMFKPANFSYSNKYNGHAHHYVHYTLLCTAHIAVMVLLHSHHRLKDNITTAFSDTGWEGMVWTDLAQDTNKWCTVLNNVLGIWVPRNINFSTHQRSTWFLQTASALCHWLVAYLFIHVFSQCGNIPSKDRTFMEHKEIMLLTAFHHMIQTHTHTITLWFWWVELHVIEELLDLLRWYIAGCSNTAIPHRVHFSETCKYVNTMKEFICSDT